jgi:hypothetical protein
MPSPGTPVQLPEDGTVHVHLLQLCVSFAEAYTSCFCVYVAGHATSPFCITQSLSPKGALAVGAQTSPDAQSAWTSALLGASQASTSDVHELVPACSAPPPVLQDATTFAGVETFADPTAPPVTDEQVFVTAEDCTGAAQLESL